MTKAQIPREGDLYKKIEVDNITFNIIYGYYEEDERDRVEPLPVFPDLKANPIYTSEGEQIVTAVQQPCESYIPASEDNSEEWCGDCIHYGNPEKEISVCTCPENKNSEFQEGR